MALSQRLQQKLLQKLSPQQIQLMKLLQIPTISIEQRIRQEIEENPALESNENEQSDSLNEDLKDEFSTPENDAEEQDGSTDDYDNIDISEYVQDGDDEIADYKLRADNHSADDDDNKVIPIKSQTSFYDLLRNQLGLLNLDDRQFKVAEQIVGSIDEDGYLRRDNNSIVDDLAFRQNIETTAAEVEEIIRSIQLFDPAGVAARNLQECLLIQLQRMKTNGKTVDDALKIISKYFEEFTKKHYEKIQRSLDISDEQLKEIIKQIIKLNPKPGGSSADSNKVVNYIVPDFFILNNNGTLELTLNSRNAPELRISSDYRDMMKEYERGSKKDKRQKEAVLFIKQKIDSAKWFIDAIIQRQHTLQDTMTAIMNYQKEFFITGDETNLKPMILKNIAEQVGLDISTVSRVSNSKFVQTEFGTYSLKYFFSESLSTDSGKEVSTREVKKILTDIIDAENKKRPYSDDKLTTLLQEKGYNIARRTVAKYREQLNIPVARLRKQL